MPTGEISPEESSDFSSKDEKWLNKLGDQAEEELSRTDEDKTIVLYIETAEDVRRQLKSYNQDIPENDEQMIVHIVAGYRFENNRHKKDDILARTQYMAQIEESDEKRKYLEITIELIMKGQLYEDKY